MAVKKTRAQSKDYKLTGEQFDAMTAAQRAKVISEIEAQSPEDRLAGSQPMNAQELKRWKGIQKKMVGRPKLGKHGTRIVSVTVEKTLLKRADAYAKANGIKRSELFEISVAEKIEQ